MLMSRLVVWMLSLGLSVFGAGMASGQATSTGSGQDYPNKPIRIVTSNPGGSSDFSSRLIAQGISGPLGQQVVVDNRPAGVIPGQIVAKAPPDGYTLLVTGSSFWTGPLFEETPYDPVKEFAPITLVARAPNILVLHPSLPVKSVKDLITLAKARPGELNYASGGTGSSNHLAAELFKAMAGVNMVRVRYKGSAPALSDLIGGQVQLMFSSAASVAPHIKSGRLRPLAVSSAEPSALAPGLPTIAASGVPGYESETISGIFAPARTPAMTINRLNREIVRFLRTAEAKEKYFNSGVEAVGNSPAEFVTVIRSEITRLDKMIKETGVRAE